jgi:hypothetical protein
MADPTLAETHDTSEIRTILARIEERLNHVASDVAVVAIESTLTATLPHLATKADIAARPTRTEMWTMTATMTGSFALILTGLTFLQHWLR